MKTNLILAGLTAVTLATAAVAGPGKKTANTTAVTKAVMYKVDASKSTLVWNGKKVTGEHSGNIKVKDGAFVVDGNKVTGGEFTFDMNSITDTDIADATYNAKLIGHLKGDDFFSTAKHPTSTFKITKVAPKGGDQYDVTGNMTIKGITNAITFPATVKVTPAGISADGKATIDRTKFDIRYGSKSFFESIGDKAIHDDFTVEMKLVANK
ncbi:YceI family protein [Fibrella sp. HMF5335]|uniref:YceI family protein n=1 Tax=Fibrella rubiginis TaxID=2817060 RepID=A0A939GG80_9BACT|nr:YceI family protein [Fibrella rubiginis]MBO0936225.1 YceI family protein [Fibrella rubiginis]